MKSLATLTVLLLALCTTGLAWGQPTAPPPTLPSASPTGTTGSGNALLAAAILVVALLVLLGITVKLLDLKRRRESEAVQLQAQVSDALLREQSFFALPVTPTAHVPLWSGTPAIVELAGQVPTPEAKDAALRLVRREAARVRPDVHIEDRLAVIPTMARAA
jgi:hypothetical protein